MNAAHLSFEEEMKVQDKIKADQKKRELGLLSLQRAQVWFLEAIQQTTVDMYERIVVMLESALFHQNDASQMIHDAYTPVRRDYHNLQVDSDGARNPPEDY